MRDKILAALQQAGHGLTVNRLAGEIASNTISYLDSTILIPELKAMELDKLVILHRADGSAGTQKGEIVLVTLRKNF